MKITLEITVKKGDGPKQDPDEVVSLLSELVEDIGEFFVQDAEHDDETAYSVESVKHVSTA